MSSIRTIEICTFVMRAAYKLRLLPYNVRILKAKANEGGYQFQFYNESDSHRTQRIAMVTVSTVVRLAAESIGLWWDYINANADLTTIGRLIFFVALCTDGMSLFTLLLQNLLGTEFKHMSDMFGRMELGFRSFR